MCILVLPIEKVLRMALACCSMLTQAMRSYQSVSEFLLVVQAKLGWFWFLRLHSSHHHCLGLRFLLSSCIFAVPISQCLWRKSMCVCTANIHSSCYLLDSFRTKCRCECLCVHVSVFGTGCQVLHRLKLGCDFNWVIFIKTQVPCEFIAFNKSIEKCTNIQMFALVIEEQ